MSPVAKTEIKINELTSSEAMLAHELGDPEFRAEWERTAFARVVAVTILNYRAKHDLSQKELAARLEMPPSNVSRLENGEHTPSLEKLAEISSRLDIEFAIGITPGEREPSLLTKRARNAGAVERVGGGRVHVASG